MDRVIVVDNSDDPAETLLNALAGIGTILIQMQGNQGIATALNAGCRRAMELGYDWVLTMDQDSAAPEDLVTGLARCLDTEDAERIAILCPEWEQVGGLPVETSADCVDLDFVMTSGSLMRLAAFDELGGFRDDFFIDEVDHEFCLRARLAGWRIVRRRDVVLRHRQGTLTRVTFPVPCYISDYSPVRYYYMTRNRMEMKRLYGKRFPGWVAHDRSGQPKRLLKMLAAEPHPLAKLAMMWRGRVDFRAGRFGRYEDARRS